jgi:hypothetical protein
MYRVFVSLNGDFPNIGDAVIRRMALDWVRTNEGVYAYTANAPDMWLEQVGVLPTDTLFRSRSSFGSWAKAILTSPKRPVLVLEPGEVVLDKANLRRELGLLAIFIIVRLKRGVIILPPRAIAKPHPITTFVHKMSIRLANTVLWRDEPSMKAMRFGKSSPDIAFGLDLRVGQATSERGTLMVTMRGRRAMQAPAWHDAIVRFAAEENLSIITFAQVRDDEDRAAELALRLGGTHLRWVDNDLAHEALLREAYDKARYVISDRLHVLIISSLSGAAPVELASKPAAKIATHFARIGVHDVSMDTTHESEDAIVGFLKTRSVQTPEVLKHVRAAHESIGSWRRIVRQKLGIRD